MPWYVILILCIAIGGGLFFFLRYRDRKERQAQAQPAIDAAKRTQAVFNSLVVTTPAVEGQFPTVKSQTALSDELRQGIIDGFADVTARARALGWGIGFNPAEYTIYVFPSVRDHNPDDTYAPSFPVYFPAGGNYDESEFDQEKGVPGGYLFASEQVITRANGTVYPDATNEFIIAMNNSREYTARVVSYGLEHILAFRNSPGFYYNTITHLNGGHPIF